MKLLLLFLFLVGANAQYCSDSYGTIDENGHLDLLDTGGWGIIGNNGGYAWYSSCTNFKSLFIPNSVNTIWHNVFKDATDLESVTFEDNSVLTTIEQDLFKGTSSLTSIIIPNSVTLIEHGAFENSGLSSITLPSSNLVIKNDVFKGTSLNSLNFSNDVSLLCPIDSVVSEISVTPEKVTVKSDGSGIATIDITASSSGPSTCSEFVQSWVDGSCNCAA